MQIALPFTEAVALATSQSPLPEMVSSLTCAGSTVHAEIDLRGIRSTSTAMRFALAAAGTVAVSGRVVSFSSGVATIAVTAHAWGLPAHKLLPYLVDPIERGIRERGLPDGLLRIERGDPDPLVLVDLQKAVSSRVSGLTVTALSIEDAVIRASADVGDFRVA